MATTIASKLLEWKWVFHEKGLMAYWNELRRLTTGVTSSYPTAPAVIGTIDYATHLDPDVVSTTHVPQAVGYTGSAVYGTSPPTQGQA